MRECGHGTVCQSCAYEITALAAVLERKSVLTQQELLKGIKRLKEKPAKSS